MVINPRQGFKPSDRTVLCRIAQESLQTCRERNSGHTRIGKKSQRRNKIQRGALETVTSTVSHLVEKGKGVQQTKKGKEKCKPKNKSKGKGQSTATNKSQTKSLKRKEEDIQGSRLWKRNERRKNGGKTGKKIERSKTFDDPVIHLFSNVMEGAAMQN